MPPIKQSEFDLQCECVNLLEVYKAQNKISFFTAIPNSTFIPNSQAKFSILKKLKLAGVRSGMPDLMVAIEGIAYFIELKTETGTLQESQKEVIKALDRAFVVTNFEEFKVLIDDIVNSIGTQLKLTETNYFKNQYKGARTLKKLKNL